MYLFHLRGVLARFFSCAFKLELDIGDQQSINIVDDAYSTIGHWLLSHIDGCDTNDPAFDDAVYFDAGPQSNIGTPPRLGLITPPDSYSPLTQLSEGVNPPLPPSSTYKERDYLPTHPNPYNDKAQFGEDDLKHPTKLQRSSVKAVPDKDVDNIIVVVIHPPAIVEGPSNGDNSLHSNSSIPHSSNTQST
ncbi:hypothetical protein CVT24_002268 [Panaeolus cyanescens]|uniref:Uncharacterized protein n=1 Tax=Panaeolus cyanescens TaxID=181874 RepID=A0A409YIE4_9AGAR|nr:hypothetical protein CVT24_002268 [Panaeolus cyanescens]